MTLHFDRADLTRDREILIRFNIAYLDWAADAVDAHFGLSLAALLGMPIPDYVDNALEKLCEGTPPSGVFYLVRDEAGTPVGMGGLREVREGTGEIKRIYVPGILRGAGVGGRILDRLIADAREFGFRSLVLDTGPFMTSAHRLYEAAGFVDIPSYPEAEVPDELYSDWRFMRCELA